MLKVYCYKKCSTCKKAIKWLDNHSIDYKYYEITEERPQEDLFKLWLQDTEKKVTYFFNTSGNLYRTMNLKDKLQELSIEEKAKLLADNGMLIKRPLVIKDDGSVLCGFKEEKYKEFL